jgi:hypothetical protein
LARDALFFKLQPLPTANATTLKTDTGVTAPAITIAVAVAVRAAVTTIRTAFTTVATAASFAAVAAVAALALRAFTVAVAARSTIRTIAHQIPQPPVCGRKATFLVTVLGLSW